MSGARAYFDQAINSNRYLLTFLGGGHALGLGPAPPEMQTHLGNQDWFEDPVWRKDRLIGISLHFITAFLDRYVKDDASCSGFIDGLVVESGRGKMGRATRDPVARAQPGWRVNAVEGFQRRHATGLSRRTPRRARRHSDGRRPSPGARTNACGILPHA